MLKPKQNQQSDDRFRGVFKPFLLLLFSSCIFAFNRLFPKVDNVCMGVGRGGREDFAPFAFENFTKKVVFLVSSGKKQISPLLAPLQKVVEKSTGGHPLEKVLPPTMNVCHESRWSLYVHYDRRNKGNLGAWPTPLFKEGPKHQGLFQRVFTFSL